MTGERDIASKEVERSNESESSCSGLLDCASDCASRSLRVAKVLGEGLVLGVADGAKEAWADKKGTAVKLAWSLGTGLLLGAASRGSTLFRVGAGMAGAGFAGAFAYDTLHHGKSIAGTISDTWNNSSDTDRNIQSMKRDLGHFAFDTGMMALGTAGAAKIGSRMKFRAGLETPASEFGIAGDTTGSSREFVVTGGHDVLARFKAGEGRSGALLSVREILGPDRQQPEILGPRKKLFMQHITQGAGLAEGSQQADLLACCNPERLNPAAQNKHLFPDGKGAVWLQTNRSGDRLRFSLGARPLSMDGQPLKLGFGDETYSPEFEKFYDRYLSEDRNVTRVDMDDARAITVKPGAKEKVIFTDSLAGCNGVAALFEQADGKRIAILSHKISLTTDSQFQQIERMARKKIDFANPISQSHAVVFSPEERISGKPGSRAPFDPAGIARLAEAFRNRLGIKDVTLLTYPDLHHTQMEGMPDHGVLMLRVPPRGHVPSYLTWVTGERKFSK